LDNWGVVTHEPVITVVHEYPAGYLLDESPIDQAKEGSGKDTPMKPSPWDFLSAFL
jgi:hypothetical protein